MIRTPRIFRRSRLLFMLLFAAALIFPDSTVQSSAEALSVVVVTPIRPDAIAKPQQSEQELINIYISDIAHKYNVDPYLVQSVVQQESNYNPTAVGDNGRSIGLMQIGPRWHKARMARLGVSDLKDPRQNILVGVDYLSELIHNQKNVEVALMVYNMGPSKASKLYHQGKISRYAKSVIARANQLRTGGI